MYCFLAGLGLFFGVHSISAINNTWRDRVAARFGEWTWKGVYSLISILGFYLLLKGYSEARLSATFIYIPPVWMNHLAALLLLPVFPLLIATYFPGRIKERTQHPMLIAVLLWSVAHLLTNGRTIDLLLFGSFLLWAALTLISYRSRDTRPVPSLTYRAINDWIAVVLGLGLYGLFVSSLHSVLIGVNPLG